MGRVEDSENWGVWEWVRGLCLGLLALLGSRAGGGGSSGMSGISRRLAILSELKLTCMSCR